MTCKRKITFVLPGVSKVPGGGYKIVYEYANHLSRRGHTVAVAHSVTGTSREPHMIDQVKNVLRRLQLAMGKNYRPDRWFQVESNVQLLFVPSLSPEWIPDADVVIATSWRTAEWVSLYSANKGRGFYLIQHLETWDGSEEEVFATWKGPLKKLVIARWLVDVAKSLGEDAIYLPNAISPTEFQMDTLPEGRDSRSIMMMYAEAEWKGCADGLEAVYEVKKRMPDLNVVLFGTPKRPVLLPHWIEYYRQPAPRTLRGLYNRAAVFVAPSWSEGWSLPASEAMLCGAAVAATDEGGHREYAFHEDTALVSPVRNPRELANNILRLVSDGEMRVRIARRGHEYIQRFTWDAATSGLESILCDRA